MPRYGLPVHGAVVGLWLGAPSAAAVFVDGELRAAVRQEVIDREPGSQAFPSGALDAALDLAGVRPSGVRLVVDQGGGVSGLVHRRALGRRLREARTTGEVQLVPEERVRSWLATRPEGWARVAQANAVAVAAMACRGTVPPGPPAWGPDIEEIPAFRALGNANLPREKTHIESDHLVLARGRLWFAGADPTRARRDRERLHELVGPDGVVPATPTDVIRAWRLLPGADLQLGPWGFLYSSLARGGNS